MLDNFLSALREAAAETHKEFQEFHGQDGKVDVQPVLAGAIDEMRPRNIGGNQSDRPLNKVGKYLLLATFDKYCNKFCMRSWSEKQQKK
jgi:hypothetical protein